MGLIIQLCPTPCDPVDYSPPGSSLHGIFQARIPEWIALSSSRGSSWPSDQTWISCVSCTAEGLFTLWAIREARDSKMSASPIFFLLLIFILYCTIFHLVLCLFQVYSKQSDAVIYIYIYIYVYMYMCVCVCVFLFLEDRTCTFPSWILPVT